MHHHQIHNPNTYNLTTTSKEQRKTNASQIFKSNKDVLIL